MPSCQGEGPVTSPHSLRGWCIAFGTALACNHPMVARLLHGAGLLQEEGNISDSAAGHCLFLILLRVGSWLQESCVGQEAMGTQRQQLTAALRAKSVLALPPPVDPLLAHADVAMLEVVAAPQALRGLSSSCSHLDPLLAFLICRPEELVPAHSSGDAVRPAAGPTTEDELVAVSRWAPVTASSGSPASAAAIALCKVCCTPCIQRLSVGHSVLSGPSRWSSTSSGPPVG